MYLRLLLKIMQYIIFHGSFGNTNENWFPWLKTTLETKGEKVILEQFPCEDYDSIKDENFICKNQNLDNWLNHFKVNVLTKINFKDDIVLIGHSIAPAFILRIVEKFNIKVKKAIFVSPFLDFVSTDLWQYTLVNSTFLEKPFDFKKINSLIEKSVVFYGDNDPYISDIKTFLNFANKVNAKTICVHNGGHLSASFGFTEFPQILREIY